MPSAFSSRQIGLFSRAFARRTAGIKLGRGATTNREATTAFLTQAEGAAGRFSSNQPVDFAMAGIAASACPGQVGYSFDGRSLENRDAFANLGFRNLFARTEQPLGPGLRNWTPGRGCLRGFHFQKGKGINLRDHLPSAGQGNSRCQPVSWCRTGSRPSQCFPRTRRPSVP